MTRVVVCRTGHAPAVEDTDGSLGALQKLVGGFIESHGLGDGFALVCNEDGVDLELPQNACGILGDFFITKYDEAGEMVSLTDDDVAQAGAWWATYRTVRHRKTPMEVHTFESLDALFRWRDEQADAARHAN